LSFTAYDLWMHKNDREVPRTEQIFHAIILPCVLIFISSAIAGYKIIAMIALALCLPCMIVDELIYHQHLHIKERRIHGLAGLSFISFVAYWIWTIY
jgi:hypothetical protein